MNNLIFCNVEIVMKYEYKGDEKLSQDVLHRNHQTIFSASLKKTENQQKNFVLKNTQKKILQFQKKNKIKGEKRQLTNLGGEQSQHVH